MRALPCRGWRRAPPSLLPICERSVGSRFGRAATACASSSSGRRWAIRGRARASGREHVPAKWTPVRRENVRPNNRSTFRRSGHRFAERTCDQAKQRHRCARGHRHRDHRRRPSLRRRGRAHGRSRPPPVGLRADGQARPRRYAGRRPCAGPRDRQPPPRRPHRPAGRDGRLPGAPARRRAPPRARDRDAARPSRPQVHRRSGRPAAPEPRAAFQQSRGEGGRADAARSGAGASGRAHEELSCRRRATSSARPSPSHSSRARA